MAITMKTDPEKVISFSPHPVGWKTLRLVGFKPKKSANSDSINFNAEFEIQDPEVSPDSSVKYSTMIFFGLNTNFAPAHLNMVRGLGFDLEDDGSMPGAWIFDPSKPEMNPDNTLNCAYQGPLLGQTMEAEIAHKEYQGNTSAQIRQIKWKFTGVNPKWPTAKPATNLIGKN